MAQTYRKEKVAILGNSVPMLIFPSRKSLEDLTYAEHLERNGFNIINASKQAVTIADVYRYFEDEVLRHYPDYIIIHFGIVEATCRARPRWLFNYFGENAWKNNIVNIPYLSIYERARRRVTKLLYKLIERILFKIGIRWRFLSPAKYEHALKDIIRAIEAQTPAKKIIIIGMFSIGSSLEKIAPGTAKSVVEFNNIMLKMEGYNKKVYFFGLDSLIKGSLLDISPDNIHLNALGHSLLAQKLSQLISN